MIFYTAELIDNTTSDIYYYSEQNASYDILPTGKKITLCVPSEASTECFIITYYNSCLSNAGSYDLGRFKKIDTFTNEPEIITEEVIKEVPVETSKIITLAEVIGQEVETITFR